MLVVLCTGTPARADLIGLCDLHWNRTALALAAFLYSRVPVVPLDGWADEAWHEMQALTVRQREQQNVDPVHASALRDMSLTEGEVILARDFGPGAATRGPAPPFEGALGGIAGGVIVGNAYAEGLSSYTEAQMLEALAGVPEAAVNFAASVARFTDAALRITLNLRGILLQETRVNWDTAQKEKRGLQDRLAPFKKKRTQEGLKATVRAGQRMAVLERIARSMFKIVFGVMLGIALWALVRRF